MTNPSIQNVPGYRELLSLIGSMAGGAKNVTVQNNTGSTISKGSVVYINGSNGSLPTVAKARANAIATMPATGIATTDIPTSTPGIVQFVGLLSAVDTSAFAAGDKLYVSAATAGALTATAPAHPNISQTVAVVITVSATAGVIFIFPGIDPHGIELGTYSNTFKVGDAAAGAKVLEFVANFVGLLSWTPTAARTLTLPDATDTLVGKATTDTLTNKTLVVANNTITTAASGGLSSTELNAALAELQAEIEALDARVTALEGP